MQNKGFTLIELLVVIAIIAILASILFPVFVSAKQAGQTASCLSNLNQIAKAVIMYADDNNGTCVPCSGFPPAHPYPLTWRWLVKPYLKSSSKVYVCPATPREAIAIGGYKDVVSNYGLNYNIFAAQGPSAWGYYPAWKYDRPNSSRMLMLVHSRGWTNAHVMMLKAPDIYTWIPYPHSNMNAIAFMDGHVRTIKIRNTVGRKPSEFMWLDVQAVESWGGLRGKSPWDFIQQDVIDVLQASWPADYGGN